MQMCSSHAGLFNASSQLMQSALTMHVLDVLACYILCCHSNMVAQSSSFLQGYKVDDGPSLLSAVFNIFSVRVLSVYL